jgi:phosphatidylglycerophosphatase C
VPTTKKLYVFDVDETITNHDSLGMLLQFCQPGWAASLLFTLKAGLHILLKGALLNRGKAKALLLQQLFGNQTAAENEALGQAFFKAKLLPDLKPKALQYIEKLRQQDPKVSIVLLSASCKEWLQPLATHLQATLICTELAYDEAQRLNGQLQTPNCKGAEKVRRLLDCFDEKQHLFICFGNSPADKHLKKISQEFYYRYF